jgi:hypothetical protein
VAGGDERTYQITLYQIAMYKLALEQNNEICGFLKSDRDFKDFSQAIKEGECLGSAMVKSYQ